MDLALPQAVASAVTAVVSTVLDRILEEDVRSLRMYQEVGIVLSASSLLSSHGREATMVGDMWGVFTELEKGLQIDFCCKPEGAGAGLPVAQVIRGSGGTHLQLFWDAAHYAVLEQNDVLAGRTMDVMAVFFSVGVNEMSTIGNTFGDTSQEDEINAIGMERLRYYYMRFMEWVASLPHPEDSGLGEAQLQALEAEMAQLTQEMRAEDHYKQVSLLNLSASCARRMCGATWISCKSAKDRTSLLCTLEAVKVFRQQGVLPDEVSDEDIRSKLRANGVRIQNCSINTGGDPLFAFNVLQWTALPDELRPPMECIGKVDS